jgi:hypothetical protein
MAGGPFGEADCEELSRYAAFPPFAPPNDLAAAIDSANRADYA